MASYIIDEHQCMHDIQKKKKHTQIKAFMGLIFVTIFFFLL